MQYKSYLLEDNINLLKHNIILFHGENLGLKSDLKKKIIKNLAGYEFLNFYQEEIIKNKDLIFNEVNNLSLFEKNKILLIEQADDKILDIIQNIVENFKDQKIFIFSNLLDKRSKLRNFFEKCDMCGIVHCYPDNELSFKKIIAKRLANFKGLSNLNINLILQTVNLNRVKLNNELDKIVLYFLDRELNTTKLIQILNPQENDDFNNLKDAALLGNKTRTNELLSNTFFESEKNLYYLNSINQRLNKIYEVKQLSIDTSLDDAINKIKPPIFWKDKSNFINQEKKWSIKKIEEILKKTYDLEIKIKSNSSLNKDLLLKKLVLEICVSANS